MAPSELLGYWLAVGTHSCLKEVLQQSWNYNSKGMPLSYSHWLRDSCKLVAPVVFSQKIMLKLCALLAFVAGVSLVADLQIPRPESHRKSMGLHERESCGLQSTLAKHLKVLICDVWVTDIPIEYCKSLIHSMPCRIQMVLKKGLQTKYRPDTNV